jgi:hypothetical protein
MKPLLLVAILLLGAAAPALAEPSSLHEAVGAPADLKLSGSVRARWEGLDGQVRPGLPDREDLFSFRTILGAEYGTGPLRIGAELWDSRAYGARPGGSLSTNEVNTFELVQAYAAIRLKGPLGEGSTGRLQLGRFMMNLGSRRFAAADDYRNTTNGSTGGRLDLRARSGGALTLFYVLPQLRRPDDQASLLDNQPGLDRETRALRFWGGLADHPAGRIGTVEAGIYGLDERDLPGRPNRNRHLRTLSARVIRNPAPHRFDYESEAAYQFGEVRAGLQPNADVLEVSAGFFHLDAGYQFAGGWKPHLSVEYDWASGDEGGGRYNRFDTLFGMRRADFAVSGLYSAIARTNLSTPGVRLEVQPNARTDAHLTARAMWLASATDAFASTNLRDPTGGSGRYAGEQVEGRVRYWLIPDALRFEADAVWLHKGRFLKQAPSAPRAHDTAYLSLNLTASF